jgi:hypothetical protein
MAPQCSGDASEGDPGKERLDARNGNKLEVIWKYPRPIRNLHDDPNSNSRGRYRLRRRGPGTSLRTGPFDRRNANELRLGIMPFDRSLRLCERRRNGHRSSRLGCVPQASSLQVVSGSIATPPFRGVGGPTTTTLPPTMIHPSLAAPDLRTLR